MTRIDTKSRPSAIALGSPPEIAAALPHLLGFHAEESLICLWLQDGELLVVQRADLTESASQREYIEAYLDAASTIPADGVVIVCVTRDEDDGVSLVRGMTEHIKSEIDNVHVRAAMIISGGQVRSADQGSNWEWISADHRQRADEVFGSRSDAPSVRRNRREVVSEVEYDESTSDANPRGLPPDIDGLCSVLAHGAVVGSRGRRLLREAGVGVQGRDLIVWWSAQVPLDMRRELLEVLLSGLRATAPGLAAHLACATAATAWLCGDGVRANAALDRCLEEQPVHSMGRMLETAMAAAVPPSSLAQMLAEVEPEVVGASQAVVDSLKKWGYSSR